MDSSLTHLRELTRRGFLKGAAAAAGVVAASSVLPRQLAAAAVPAEEWWLGPDLWANRLQDWCVRNGRITCVAPAGQRRVRTAALLTKRLNGGPARLVVQTGTNTTGAGFSGFLVGTGESGTDYRRAALVLSASGQAGGMLCVYESDGRVRFREHTDESAPTAYGELPSTSSGPAPARFRGDKVKLTLAVAPESGGRLTLTLTAVDVTTKALRSQAVLSGVDPARVKGGISLVSSGFPKPGATYWFSGLQTLDAGFDVFPERTMGPIAGVLFSLAGTTLKMTAQLMPMLPRANDAVTLELRDPVTNAWVSRANAPVGAGFTALLRVEGWDTSRGRDYRVVFSRGGTFEGSVPAEPSTGELRVVTLSCAKASHRPIDQATSSQPRVAGEQALGLYSSRNVWFPHEQLAAGISAQKPDLLVAMGDQIYENHPTAKDRAPAPELDFLYKYLLWLWSFRDITRRTPCLVMVDDHDVFQGSIWGEGGIPLPAGATSSAGGYANAPEWVNVVQRVQCGHNPDPVDPSPVAQDITVYFTTFTYGGVDFVLLEDRKFKTGSDQKDPAGIPIATEALQLLGPRQEALLQQVVDSGTGRPRVVLTQSLYGCLQTTGDGRPGKNPDSNGWPPAGRARALASITAMGAVMLSGDTHLAALVRHVDGPLQFSGPAGSASYARWFEPAAPLANPGALPYTGDYVDGFGNRLQVLAVANPHVSQATWLGAGGTNDFGDRALKEEGYGLLEVDMRNRRHIFQAWRWDVDPTAPGATPMPGWPYELSFDDV